MSGEKKPTKAEWRVKLAKDVLVKLKAKKINAQFGQYCVVNDDATCEVCALGSMVVACCPPEPGADLFEDDVRECLKGLFSDSQLALIEAAYEGDAHMPYAEAFATSGTKKLIKAASMFPGEREDLYGDGINLLKPASVLAAIMRNIIRNKGEFRV